jgi:ketosteroid isomerase-like protein
MADMYDDDIVLLASPGSQPVSVRAAVRKVAEEFVGLGGAMRLLGSTQVVSNDTALTMDHWRFEASGAELIEGTMSDVLRRQADGSWKHLMDNPFGTAVVQPT